MPPRLPDLLVVHFWKVSYFLESQFVTRKRRDDKMKSAVCHGSRKLSRHEFVRDVFGCPALADARTHRPPVCSRIELDAYGDGVDTGHVSVRGARPPGCRRAPRPTTRYARSEDLHHSTSRRGRGVERKRRPARELAAEVLVRRGMHGVQLVGQAAEVQERTREDLVRNASTPPSLPRRTRRDVTNVERS